MIHKVCEFYKKVYLLNSKIPKRDKFGIYLKIENVCLKLATLIITAAFETRIAKIPILSSARIQIELLKRLIRITNELNIIPRNKYLDLESDLQEISRMTNGWIKYLTAAQ